MNGEDMVSQNQFNSLRKDVKEIKNALLGSEVYGQKGYLHRLEDVEEDVEHLKNFKKKVFWYGSGAIAAGSFFGVVLFQLVDRFL
jgi:predicted RNA-binding protein with EMAP domain